MLFFVFLFSILSVALFLTLGLGYQNLGASLACACMAVIAWMSRRHMLLKADAERLKGYEAGRQANQSSASAQSTLGTSPPSGTQHPTPSGLLVDRIPHLERLAALKERGALTEDEFALLKARVLLGPSALFVRSGSESAGGGRGKQATEAPSEDHTLPLWVSPEDRTPTLLRSETEMEGETIRSGEIPRKHDSLDYFIAAMIIVVPGVFLALVLKGC